MKCRNICGPCPIIIGIIESVIFLVLLAFLVLFIYIVQKMCELPVYTVADGITHMIAGVTMMIVCVGTFALMIIAPCMYGSKVRSNCEDERAEED